MRFLFSLLSLLIFTSTVHAQEIAGPAYVIDADTLDIAGQRVRLEGIDAPESDQTCEMAQGPVRCGDAATLFVRDQVQNTQVHCQINSYDRYDRALSTCFVNGTNLNALIVEKGWAMAYRRYSSAYINEEETAKAQNLGIWQTQFLPPWEWRRR